MANSRKLTDLEIQNIIQQYPEIAKKIIRDYEVLKIINKRFSKSEQKKIQNLQIENKISLTLRTKI